MEQIIPVDMNIPVGMNTSKHVFQVPGVNAAEEPVLRKRLLRKEMVEFSASSRRLWWRSKRAAVRTTGRGSCKC